MDIYSCIRKDIEDNVYQSDQRLPSEQKELFDLKDDDKLWEIYIIRYYKNIPYVLGKSYIPYHRVPDFNTHYQRSLSIYTVLEKIYGIKPSRSSSECKVTMSDKRESRLLSIFDHSPLLKVTSLNEDQNKAVIEQCISKFRADIVQLTIKLQ